MTNKHFDKCINECISYIRNEEDRTQTELYIRELLDVVNLHNYDWHYFTSTGIFHDAIGKVVNFTVGVVETTAEY